MKGLTIRTGDLEMDHGDQHFRMTDGGNPFFENYIIDEYLTEIGAELNYHSKKDFLAMGELRMAN